MKLNELITIAGLTVLLGAQYAQAQDVDENAADDAELTMTLITDPEAQLPAAVTNRIELPVSASDSGRLNSEDGLDTAERNRQRAQQGLETAADARERGREFGQDMADTARENRENNRGNGQENRPDLPNPPDRPEIPGPPNPPGQSGP